MKATRTEHKWLSKCCNEKVGFVPPSFGDPEFRVCMKCHASLDRDEVLYVKNEIVTHVEIQKGIFRPIENIK